jgi:hypothetical protein
MRRVAHVKFNQQAAKGAETVRSDYATRKKTPNDK